MYKHTLIAVILAVVLDRIFGDPYSIPHPVRYIGRLTAFLDEKLRVVCKKNAKKERIYGFVLVLLVIALTEGTVFICLFIAYHIHVIVGVILETFWCYQLLAARCLQLESKKVYDALMDNNIENARMAVSMIVGRDTERLDDSGITKAAVETVAENTSDGVIAPLMFMMLFGALGGFFYKAVNTMDSMVGYKNDKYVYFGTSSARLDDICNYIPSRLSGLLMIVTAAFCRYDAKNAYRIWKRDRRKHASPNSAQTESACAGALNIRLAGDAWYFGIKHEKPYIGDDMRRIEAEDIRRSWKLMYGSEYLLLLLYISVKLLLGVYL